MRSLLRLLFRVENFTLLEAVLISLFFLQALQFLVGTLYSRIAAASVITLVGGAANLTPGLNGVVEPALVQTEIIMLGFVIGLPILGVLVGRIKWFFIIAVFITIAGRTMMVLPTLILTETAAAAIAVGGGLLYLTLLIRNRATLLPYFFILGLAFNQIYRAVGNTLDPSWSPTYFQVQGILSIFTVVITISIFIRTRRRNTNPADQGILSFWSGIALGTLIFLEVSLLALPNAIAGRTNADYTIFAPIVLIATLMPLIPVVRLQAKRFLSLFDITTRGWAWLIFIVLLVVLGLRVPLLTITLPISGFSGVQIPLGAISLIIVQFTMSLMWWWMVRPQAQSERNFTGLWIALSMLAFTLFFVFDIFTYDYAFVGDFAAPLDVLNPIVPALLRGFRGMGIAVIVLACFMATMPILQSTRRAPWVDGTRLQSLLGIIFTALMSGSVWYAVRPPLIQPVINTPEIRIATYNIHAGYNEVFHYELENIARAIEQSGADVVLLQEVEAGRLTSLGVDQSLWLARRLRMDTRFLPTNEGLQGLAILSKVPIVFDDGTLLTSIGRQTGLQRVQIQPDEQVINIYNTSLGLLLADEAQSDRENNQMQQFAEISAIINNHIRTDYNGQAGRLILGGTFNNVPDSPLIQQVQQTGFNDPFAGSNVDLTATFIRTGYRARIDYLWLLGQTLQSTGINVIRDNTASDHRLAVVGIVINRSTTP